MDQSNREPHVRANSLHPALRVRDVIARELSGSEREHVWNAGLSVYPGAAAYARRASRRTIAVFLLTPATE